MSKIAIVSLCGLLSLSVVGCDSMTKQDVGVVTGGTLGALVGSTFGGGSGKAVAIAAGAIVGGVIGGQIGKSMDKADQNQVYKTLENTPTHQAASWHNPDTGNAYTVTPTKTYQKSGKYCREYTTQAVINGKTQTVYGTACRQPDGSWKAA